MKCILKLISIIFLVLVLFLFSCNKPSQSSYVKTIDFEQVSTDSLFFISSINDKISTKNILHNKDAHSGNNSIKIKPKDIYFLDTIKINSSEALKLSLWRKGNNKAFVVFKTEKGDIRNIVRKAIEKDKNGWDRISYIFRLPPFYKSEEIIILVYNHSEKESALFDDFSIEKVKNILPNSFESDKIEILIDSTGIKKLTKYRKKALKNKTISQKSKQWVDALFISRADTFKVELRFKGDWLDHIEGYKWSMRIKIKGDNYWKGFKIFSIQNPDSKYIFDEYTYHKILKDNDVLTTNYGFIPLKINGVFAGIFSYEEHFTRQLVESKKRREGPILKFDEEPFWATNNYNVNNKENKLTLPIFETAKIIPFGAKRINKNEKLKENYYVAQDLLYTFKKTDSIENIIDIDKFAKFYSVVDLTGAYHSLIWHNIRFYYNPVSNIIEPIAFDGFTEEGIYPWTHNNMLISCCNSGLYPDNYFIMKLFKNYRFKNNYIESIKRINDNDYYSEFVNNNKEEIKHYEQILNIDYPNIKYDTLYITNRIKENNIIIANINNYNSSNRKKNNRKCSLKYPIKIAKKYINVYPTNNTNSYLIDNYNLYDLSLIGFSNNKDSINFISEVKIASLQENKLFTKTIALNKKVKYLFFTSIDREDTVRVKVNKFKKPNVFELEKDVIENIKYFNNVITISNNSIIFKEGKHIINKPLVIPSGYKVLINKNTELDFIKNSYFLSYSAIQINGSEINPIIFTSSDKTAKGITIIQAGEKSEINNLTIENFNTHDNNGWILTGALTFYESDVNINNLVITKNICEDALNIVNSEFELKNSHFENVFSDAFDSDFSNGTINNCTFSYVGNDAIDFSGSYAEISHCSMINIGDKAISAGENSNLQVSKTKVNNANIGFASKDKSLLTVKDSEIKNSKYAYAAYIKKREFGKSELKVLNTKYDKIHQLTLIDKYCKIIIDNKENIGKESINIESLYEKFKKK